MGQEVDWTTLRVRRRRLTYIKAPLKQQHRQLPQQQELKGFSIAFEGL